MKTGMLWFDNNPTTTLSEKVIRAVAYYTDKYGRVPNKCFVHPSALEGETNISGIAVRPFRSVLPGHFWLGVDET